jgi:aspartate/methionine/tyrosine aminotransferase
MKGILVDRQLVDKKIKELGLKNLSYISIGEMRALIEAIEEAAGLSFVRMEIGIPGLKPPKVCIDAEIKALKKGIASVYPDIKGIPPLKEEIARFAALFLDIRVSPRNCIPAVGSVNGSYTAFMVSGRRDEKKDTLLFIDPGFNLHKQCAKMIGLKQENFDVYPFRGEKLKDKLESYLKKGHISTIVYSSPNNPTWICFTPRELQIIGEMAARYDAVVVEDLAYLGMDFRQDFSTPGQPPFQPTAAQYTPNYILLISSSKVFSYAGQRASMMIISDELSRSNHQGLLKYYSTENFGHAIVYGTLLATTSGVAHSAQYALAATLKAVNDGSYRFIDPLKIYGEKAAVIKKIFTRNGFEILYSMDEGRPIADGFYFTVSYPGMSGDTLIKELLCRGISAMSLASTGSEKTEGLRICVSLVSNRQLPQLEERLALFNQHQTKNQTG